MTHTLVMLLSIFLQDWKIGCFIALWFGHCDLDYVIFKIGSRSNKLTMYFSMDKYEE